MTDLPFVSVVVAARNAARILPACVEALLGQDYPPERREIIFVDNGSGDRSVELLAGYPVRVALEHRLRGPSSARNEGIRASRGEVIAFTDADCIAFPDWLSRLVQPYADPGVGAVAGQVQPWPPTTLVERFCADSGMMSQEYAVRHPFLPAAQTCNVSFRRVVLERIGLFDVALRGGEDTDLAWRMQLQTGYRLTYAPEARVYHKHRTGLGKLFGQYGVFGMGDEDLSRLYPQAGYGPLRSELWVLVQNAAFTLRGLPVGLARLLLGRMTPLEFYWNYLGMATRAGRAVGRLRARARIWARPGEGDRRWNQRCLPRLETKPQ